MARIKRSVPARARHRKVLSRTRGLRGRAGKTIRAAKQSYERSLHNATCGRRLRKRDFRALWIQRINAAARSHGLTYGRFIHGLALAEIALDRKQLSELAIHDPESFARLVEEAMKSLAAAA